MGELPLGGAIDPGAFPFQVVDLHRKGATGSLKVAGRVPRSLATSSAKLDT